MHSKTQTFRRLPCPPKLLNCNVLVFSVQVVVFVGLLLLHVLNDELKVQAEITISFKYSFEKHETWSKAEHKHSAMNWLTVVMCVVCLDFNLRIRTGCFDTVFI